MFIQYALPYKLLVIVVIFYFILFSRLSPYALFAVSTIISEHNSSNSMRPKLDF